MVPKEGVEKNEMLLVSLLLVMRNKKSKALNAGIGQTWTWTWTWAWWTGTGTGTATGTGLGSEHFHFHHHHLRDLARLVHFHGEKTSTRITTPRLKSADGVQP